MFLAGDLKILKCMLGCKLGANTLYPCIYYLHTKVDATPKGTLSSSIPKGKGVKGKGTTNTGNASSQRTIQEVTKKRSMQWSQGILSCDQSKPPNRDRDDKDWNPILEIPLSRVHICSLHARLRILDKLLMLHVNYAWNMEPPVAETRFYQVWVCMVEPWP